MNLKSLSKKVADKAAQVSSTIVNTEFADAKEAVMNAATEAKIKAEAKIEEVRDQHNK